MIVHLFIAECLLFDMLTTSEQLTPALYLHGYPPIVVSIVVI